MSSSIEIAVVVALTMEEKALQKARKSLPSSDQNKIQIIRNGIGIETAYNGAKSVIADSSVRWLCSTGLGGGLQPAISTGGMFVADALWHYEKDSAEQINISVESQSFDQLPKHNAGKLLCVSDPLLTVEAKQKWGSEEGGRPAFLCVDMESAGVAKAAAEHNCRFFAAKAISDCYDETIPAEAMEFSDDQGRPRIGRVLKYMLKGSEQRSNINRLAKSGKAAAASLEQFWKDVFPMMLGK